MKPFLLVSCFFDTIDHDLLLSSERWVDFDDIGHEVKIRNYQFEKIQPQISAVVWAVVPNLKHILSLEGYLPEKSADCIHLLLPCAP